MRSSSLLVSVLSVLAACRLPEPPTPTATDRTPTAILEAAVPPTLRYGRLVDIYGFGDAASDGRLQAAGRSVLATPNLASALPPGCRFLPANPDTRRRRVAIEHPLGSDAFAAALHALESGAVEVAVTARRITVPRDAAWSATWPEHACPAQSEIRVRQAAGSPLPVLEMPFCGGIGIDAVVFGTAALVRQLPRAYGLPSGELELTVQWSNGALALPLFAEGWLSDAEPLRIVGNLTMHLERVAQDSDGELVLTLFAGDLQQAIAAGDVLRLLDTETKTPIASFEATRDVAALPTDHSRRIHVPVRPVDTHLTASAWTRCDASSRAGYPPTGEARDAFVRAHGAEVVLMTFFDPERGDDPANFVRFGNRRISSTRDNRARVPTNCSFVLEFSAPAELSTLRAAELRDRMTPHCLPVRIDASDSTETQFTLQPPLGVLMTAEKRAQIRDRQDRGIEPGDHTICVGAGEGGIRAHNGNPLATALTLPFELDPDGPDNIVGYRVF
jgi:hypothetical protein